VAALLTVSAVIAGLPGVLGAQEEIAIVASKGGFKPNVIKLRKGETARLLLRSADDEHCFALDALRIEKRINPGRPTVVELLPDRAGEFPFYCCLEPENGTLKGKLVVAE
jgi:heme/copper-type cytochrome/quinol oxidase subunit 2